MCARVLRLLVFLSIACLYFSPAGAQTRDAQIELNGHDPGDHMWGLGLEKSTRGHTLALTVTNSYATTPGQIARGGIPGALYLGFNITRRF